MDSHSASPPPRLPRYARNDDGGGQEACLLLIPIVHTMENGFRTNESY